MLQRNLMYTAVTRAKTAVFMVGQRSALELAVQTGHEAEADAEPGVLEGAFFVVTCIHFTSPRRTPVEGSMRRISRLRELLEDMGPPQAARAEGKLVS
jgi:hypothetical protein